MSIGTLVNENKIMPKRFSPPPSDSKVADMSSQTIFVVVFIFLRAFPNEGPHTIPEGSDYTIDKHLQLATNQTMCYNQTWNSNCFGNTICTLYMNKVSLNLKNVEMYKNNTRQAFNPSHLP